jgi:regulatory protein
VPGEDASPDDPQAARLAALKLLNRRDHCAAELIAKLAGRGITASTAEEAVRALERERLVDDARYAEHFVAYHAERGQGPVRIAMELRQLGVAAEVVEGAVDERSPAWRERCAAARRRRFGAGAPAEWTERARQARFLQYRGFSADQVRAAIGNDVELNE